ncbi:MAG: methionine--tRNA ligase [Candidatus Marsarchaeota archaeon]|nr:methionine--tRNA ligase [Candidatus Marsarchaeota archaeon]
MSEKIPTKDRIIVTSALPYSEAVPHLGNFVGSILPADVFAKYLEMKGEDYIFICGSDQHGTPIEIMALKKGVEPMQLSNEVHEEIKKVLSDFECNFTYYGKTDSEQNKAAVYELIGALSKNGCLTETERTQPYCLVDKRILTDRFIEGTCPYCGASDARGDQCDNCGHLLDPSDLIKPHCVICGSEKIEFRKTKNLALDFPKLQPDILAFVRSHSKNNWSKNAVNKTLSYIEQGLKPRDITRDMSFGFPVPIKGFEGKKIYVWFDAVIGYIGITREWSDSKWKAYWKSPGTKLIQFMGKDNIEFHTMMWPGILIGANDGYVLPHTIMAYEYLNAKGLKFSKSRGIGLNMQNSLGIMPADYWRFALMHMLPENADSEFTIAGFVEIVNKIMNDKIGNLVNRTLTLQANNTALGCSPRRAEQVGAQIKEYMENFESVRMREALHNVIRIAELGNETMSAEEPWALAKKAQGSAEAAQKFKSVMGTLIDIVHVLGVLLYPFTPAASASILGYFGQRAVPTLKALDGPKQVTGSAGVRPIFRKVSAEEVKKMEKFSGA